VTQPKPKLTTLLTNRKKTVGKSRDTAKVRLEWINAVRGLLVSIEEWLADLRKKGLADWERGSVSVTEEGLGTYQSEQLTLRLAGDELLVVRPVARIIIGGAGRVDVVSGPRREMLIRDKKLVWHVAKRDPQLKLTKLNKAVFEDLLAEMLSAA